MRIAPPFCQGFHVLLAAGLALGLASACKPAAALSKPPKTVAATTNSAAALATNVLAENTSLFEQMMPPKGRDPFFPNSHRREPVPVLASRGDKLPAASELSLKGVVGSAGHRLAIINNSLLETGEEETMHVASGRLRVRCMEIGEDYAVVKVEGQIQPKRLELNKKSL